MATVITAADVVTMFGDYYQNQGQSESDIKTRLREIFETKDAFTVVESEDTIFRTTNAAFSEALQSFQKVFTPKGGVAFAPSEFRLFNVKVDESFYPDDLKNSWLAFMTSNKLDRTTWPFVRWFIEVYVLGQIDEDLETKAIFGGVYVAPTPGTPNDAADTMNGIRKIINDGVDAGDIIPLTTGAPNSTPATWTGQIEAFGEMIPELYKKKDMVINMSRALARRYVRGRRAFYNVQYNQVNDLKVVEDFENLSVAGRASHDGSSKIWCTPKGNAILAFKGGSNQNIVEVEKVDRLVKVYTDFWIGLGFIDKGLIFTNEQDMDELS